VHVRKGDASRVSSSNELCIKNVPTNMAFESLMVRVTACIETLFFLITQNDQIHREMGWHGGASRGGHLGCGDNLIAPLFDSFVMPTATTKGQQRRQQMRGSWLPNVSGHDDARAFRPRRRQEPPPPSIALVPMGVGTRPNCVFVLNRHARFLLLQLIHYYTLFKPVVVTTTMLYRVKRDFTVRTLTRDLLD
jgi:hypothetical protein